ncbi:MAG: (Fe-S)-binding protein [Chloroflexota bacterium]
MEESQRVLEQCTECGLCVEDCEFLKQTCQSPKELAEKLQQGSFREDPKSPYSCNLCGLCQRLCPEDLNIGEMCFAVRQQLVQEGLAPLPKHEPVKNDQEWATSEWFSVIAPASETTGCKRFFFPGCNLAGYSADLVIATYRYLRERLPGTGIILGCCGGPTHDLGDQPGFERMLDKVRSGMARAGTSEIVVACPHCYHVFKANAPDLRLRSVYEVMAEQGLPTTGKPSSTKAFSLHDPCRTRFERTTQDCVRLLVTRMGYDVADMEYSRDKTRCCGMGGMAAYVDFRLVNRVAMRRAKEAPHDILTYCASCRQAFAMLRKPSLHLLDLVFNPDRDKAPLDGARSRSQVRESQLYLKSRLERGI